MYQLKASQQSVGAIILDSFRLLRAVWQRNVVVILVAYLIAGLVLLLFGMASWSSYIAFIHSHSAAIQSGENLYMLILQYSLMHHWLFLFLFGVTLAVWIIKLSTAVLIRITYMSAAKERASIKDGLSSALRCSFIILLHFVLLIVLAVLALVLQWAVSCLKFGLLDVLTAIIAQCFVYYVSVKLFFVDVVAVVQGLRLASFCRSWQLTAGHWWRTVSALVFSHAFFTVMIFIVGLGLFWAIFSPGLHPPFAQSLFYFYPAWFSVLFIVCFALTAIAFFVSAPSIFAATAVVLYQDLMLRMQSLDEKNKDQGSQNIVDGSV